MSYKENQSDKETSVFLIQEGLTNERMAQIMAFACTKLGECDYFQRVILVKVPHGMPIDIAVEVYKSHYE